ncbi:hypothetical protein QNO07_24935 [Streptomyces sp. 549]|uniref:hypothetical protein n=1 Tax=Streptomyces sp. 549 TaxID=3049076 RepID=UPI0024C289AF|nr:hypothetical protein [Streptomyces sp. 549]MDK1476611.1 hypothetical protein [Streptomyces sp. 549]
MVTGVVRPRLIGLRALAISIVLSIGLVACSGSDGGSSDPSERASSRTEGKASEEPADEVDTDKVIGELKGPDDISVQVHSVERDPGGFLTVNGTLANDGSKSLIANRWRSAENGVKSQSSISGATLVDTEGKKRYMILRDTDGECLCTTGLTNIKPGERRPIYAQFPSPPSNVTEVEFQLPGMSPAKLEISER